MAHDDRVSDVAASRAPRGPAGTRPRRPPLRRDADRKVVQGVCAGVARWLGIDPLLVRIVIIVLTIVRGIGLPIYIAGWLLLPTADGGPARGRSARAWRASRSPGC